MNEDLTISKKEIALRLGYVFPSNNRIDYAKLEKRVQDSGLLIKLKMDITAFKKMHKQRFDTKQMLIIKKVLDI